MKGRVVEIPVCIAKCKYSHKGTLANGAVGGLGLDQQFVGRAQELLGASRAFNTMKVARSALAKVTEMELKFGLDLSFPWTLAAGGNFVMACVTTGLKSNTIRYFSS